MRRSTATPNFGLSKTCDGSGPLDLQPTPGRHLGSGHRRELPAPTRSDRHPSYPAINASRPAGASCRGACRNTRTFGPAHPQTPSPGTPEPPSRPSRPDEVAAWPGILRTCKNVRTLYVRPLRHPRAAWRGGSIIHREGTRGAVRRCRQDVQFGRAVRWRDGDRRGNRSMPALRQWNGRSVGPLGCVGAAALGRMTERGGGRHLREGQRFADTEGPGTPDGSSTLGRRCPQLSEENG